MKFRGDCAMKCKSVFAWGIIILTLLLSGCMRNSGPVQFYMLDADSGVADTVRVSCRRSRPGDRLGADTDSGISKPATDDCSYR